MHPIRRRLALSLLVLIPLGIGTKLYGGPAAGWVHGHAGGVLYVIFWTVVVVLAVPSLSPWTVAGGVFIVTYGLEFLQLWSPSGLEAIRNTFFGHALLGSTFGRWDLLHYAIGAVCGGLFVQEVSRRTSADGLRPFNGDLTEGRS
jgi:hypothetical protein